MFSRVHLNVAANAAGTLWRVASVYLFVPLYIHALGIEAYGIIGFYTVLQGVLIVADAGLAATLTRELARMSAVPGSEREARDLVRTVEVFYWSVALLMIAAIQVVRSPLAIRWMKAGGLAESDIVAIATLMLGAVVLQFPATLYYGGLQGLQRQVLANSLQTVWSVVRNGGVVLVLVFVSADLKAFFAWHLLCNAAYSVVIGLSLWRCMEQTTPRRSATFSVKALRDVWKYALSMAAISMMSMAFMQLDKVLLSQMLPLRDFGYYALSNVVAQVPILLVNPISVAVFPVLVEHFARRDDIGLARYYHRACQMAAVATIPSALAIALFGKQVLEAWTQSPEIAQNASMILKWSIVGSLAMALAMIPNALGLAAGRVRLNIEVGVVSLAVLPVLLLGLVNRYGMVGGGMTWMAINLSLVVPYMLRLHRVVLAGEGRVWWTRDVGIPLVVSASIMWLGRRIIPGEGAGIGILTAIAACTAVSVALAGLSIPGLRQYLTLQVQRRRSGSGAL